MSEYIKREDAIGVLIETIAPPSITLDTLVMRMDNIPTVDVEPVRHGRWVEDEYEIPHCSECKAINNTVYRNYCSNCGARMGGESDE